MNTISSLLNWIGTLIGANPNTMTTSNKTIVGAVNELAARPYLVESGTSGVWTYRKWSDGISECWGQSAPKTIAPADWVAWGTGGALEAIVVDEPIGYPAGLFTAAPQVSAFITPTEGYTVVTAEVSIAGNVDLSVQTPKLYALRFTRPQATIVAVANFHAVGRWQ